jgi:ComF family protein
MNPIERVISFFAPYDCVVCENEGRPLCIECIELLPRQHSVCFLCGRASQNYKPCAGCINKNLPAHVWLACIYQTSVKKVVAEYKFEEKRALSSNIASVMDETLPYFAQAPIVTYVPTASSRLRRRGFDHAKLLAKEIAKTRGWQISSFLVRKSQARQLGAKRQTRKEQLKHVFRVINGSLIKDSHILLVDDVVTTGATIEVCAKELYKAGASQVDVVAFARTPKKHKLDDRR